jgi:3-oxoadipate enol-lactonase
MPKAENEGLRIHYELSGRGGSKTFVFSNSLGSNLRMWDKIGPLCEGKYRLLRYDTRGHGLSSTLPGPYTIAQLAGDLLFLLDHLGIERAHFCGLSLGGLVAMQLGIHAPERVDRLILANTAARIGTREMWEQRIADVESVGMAPLATAALDRWFTPSYSGGHPQEMKAIREMIAATSVMGYAACCGALRDTDLRNDIASIDARCLVIAGSHDPATPPADGRALHSLLRYAEYLELDASHLSAWERPAEFAGAVLAFLEKGERHNG